MAERELYPWEVRRSAPTPEPVVEAVVPEPVVEVIEPELVSWDTVEVEEDLDDEDA